MIVTSWKITPQRHSLRYEYAAPWLQKYANAKNLQNFAKVFANFCKFSRWLVGRVTRVGSSNRAHCGHLANTVELLCTAAMNGSATRGDNAACFQITFGNPVIN